MCYFGLVLRKLIWKGGLWVIGKIVDEVLELWWVFCMMEDVGVFFVEVEVICDCVMVEIFRCIRLIMLFLGFGGSVDIIYLF